MKGPNIIVDEINAGCDFCDHKGYVYVPDGPEDVTAEPCSYCLKEVI